MIPQVVTLGPIAAASANNIALVQALGGAGNLTLNGALVSGGVATLDVARQVGITSVGNDSGITFTVTGTNPSGNPWRETITGANAGVAVTASSFKTVTRISGSGATAGNVTSGTTAIAYSEWKMVNWHGAPVNISFAVIISGTVNYTIQVMYEDINASTATVMGSQSLGNYPTIPTPFNHPVLQALAANNDGSTNDPIVGWRVVLNSGTGSVKAIAIQSGLTEGSWV